MAKKKDITKSVAAKKAPSVYVAATGLAESERKKLRTLLKAKMPEAVTMAVSLLKSLGDSEEEWASVFSDQVMSQLIGTWDANVWKSLVEGLNSRDSLRARLKKLAIQKLDRLSGVQWERTLFHLLNVFPEAFEASLAKHKGALDLWSLTSLSEAAAESLAKYEGELRLHSLTSLSDAAAESLAKHKGRLELCGLTSLSDAAAESLAKNKWRLHLNGLTSLSDAAAASLAKQEGTLELRGLTSLSDAAAESLAKLKDARLRLMGLTSLSDTAAASLAKLKRVICSGEVAAKLQKFRGKS